ncbi:helix-turn-helix transcriptional regulator [Ruminococcaceae bacterium OttesenSCG-928-A11]|nr:helix-turn-helix transcriptional regulator [Ruminococcaceae bacterium OttesenSCG-928-A11]
MFSLTLKQLREQKDLSQRDLAKHLGVSQGAIGMWESGKREPSFATVSRIAEFFGVSTDFLLGREDINVTPKKTSPNDIDSDAGVLLDTLIDKLKKEETIQFNGYNMTRETAELLAASLAAADDMTAKLLKEKQQKEG